MSMSNVPFNPREHLISIKNRQGNTSEYLPAQWRLVWFRLAFPEGSIETEVVVIDLDRVIESEVFVWNAEKRRNEKTVKVGKGFACFKATIRSGQGGSASATGSESAVDFGDFIEKAETKAIARALAGLGFGTQFAPELNEGQRIVDSPVDAPADPPTNLVQRGDPYADVTEAQRESIRKLSEVLGIPVAEEIATSGEAKAHIQRLTAEYRSKYSKGGQSPDEQGVAPSEPGDTAGVSDIRKAYQDAYPNGNWERFVENNLGKKVDDTAMTIEQRATVWKKLQAMIANNKQRAAAIR